MSKNNKRLENILILGGTQNARELAKEWERQGHKVIMSIAGRTKDGEKREKEANPNVEVRVGGFGGAVALGEWIEANKIDKVVDATHPFAVQISENAKKAAEKSGVKLECYEREPWEKQQNDKWIEVGDIKEAVRTIPDNAKVFLALGHQYIKAFEEKENVHFVIRQVDEAKEKFRGNHEYVIGQPAQKPQEEMALFKKYEITHLVCRNSGGERGYAKIHAARKLGLPVVMIKRPDS